MAPIKPLFSSDRIPSDGKSPFTELYKPDLIQGSLDSENDGPPVIMRVTAQQKTPVRTNVESEKGAASVELPNGVQGDRRLCGVDEEAVETKEPVETYSPRTKALRRDPSYRQALANRKSRCPQQKEEKSEDVVSQEHDTPSTGDMASPNAVNSTLDESPESTSSLKRNLFPAKERTQGRPAWASRLNNGCTMKGAGDREENVNSLKVASVDSPEERAFESEKAEGASDVEPSAHLSVRDRIRALGGGGNIISSKRTDLRSSRLSPLNSQSNVDSSPAQGSQGPPIASRPVANAAARTGRDVFSSVDESDESQQQGSRKSFDTGASQAGPLGASPPDSQSQNNDRRFETEGNITPRNHFLEAAHLAATVDEVSPQDRYRRRWEATDETTATEESREVSDVNSLRSFFEAPASVPTGESDDDDDRTVESLRSKFEPEPEKVEELSGVSKMRAMFEKRNQTAASNKGFGGNNSVTDAFSKFEATGSSRSVRNGRHSLQPLKTGRDCMSPDSETDHVVAGSKAVSKSAPSKLSLARSQAISFKPSSNTEESGAGNKNQRGATDSPQFMSVAERIRALKLQQYSETSLKTEEERKVHSEPKKMTGRPSMSMQFESDKKMPMQPSEASAAAISPQCLTENKSEQEDALTAAETVPASQDPKAAKDSSRYYPSESKAREETEPKAPVARGSSYPSIMDRINAFSRVSKNLGVDSNAKESPSGDVQPSTARAKPQQTSTARHGSKGEVPLTSSHPQPEKAETRAAQEELNQSFPRGRSSRKCY